MKTIVIVGAGPAGLTAAYKMLKDKTGYKIVLIEQSYQVGGISKTVSYKENRIDLGGHRFFSKDSEVNKIWLDLLPLQGIAINKDFEVPQKEEYSGSVDPNTMDDVMLLRRRISRIYFNNRFFDYPIKLSINTLKNLGFIRSLQCGFGYIGSCIFKRKENSLEDFYINRFGKPLYSLFFEDYTTKLWGVSPAELDPSWGEQRVKKLSLLKVLIESIAKIFKRDYHSNETSLIEEFYYPKYGPGQLWEKMQDCIEKMGGTFLFGAKCSEVICENGNIKMVKVICDDGSEKMISCDYLLSSMPIKELVNSLKDVPDKVSRVANGLPYRDFITVGVLVNKLKIANTTPIMTKNDIPPDCWIYVQDRTVKMGRIQIFNNWSPFMVGNTDKVWMGLEYFCSENDDFWKQDDNSLIEMAKKELSKMGIADGCDIVDGVVLRQKKAYPAYFGEYNNFDVVKKFLNHYSNLICIGRNGQHRYNNMDHSMITGIRATEVISGKADIDSVWSVNTEKTYHEKKAGNQ